MATNMDTKKNQEATEPVLEFRLPKSEVDSPVAVGDNGHVIIPVNVLDMSDGMITFRKNGPVKCLDFKEETIESMRERIGEVEDEEMPFKKEDDEDEE